MERNFVCDPNNLCYDPENRESYIYDPELTNKATEHMFTDKT